MLHDTVRTGNSALNAQDTESVRVALHQVNTMVEVLGLNSAEESHSSTSTAAYQALEELVDAQIDARTQARQDRDWQTADAIRDQLAAAGIVVEDGADGVTWSITERN